MFDINFISALSKTLYHSDQAICKDVCNSLFSNKLKSKVWLAQEISRIMDPSNTLIIGAWYSTVIPYLISGSFTCVDIDPIPKKFTEQFGKRLGKKIKYHTCDGLDYMKFKQNQYDLIINTSCEHMEDMRPHVISGPRYAFQSNNYFNVKDHVNCKETLDDFVQSTGLNNIDYKGNLVFENYTRFMVIGSL